MLRILTPDERATHQACQRRWAWMHALRFDGDVSMGLDVDAAWSRVATAWWSSPEDRAWAGLAVIGAWRRERLEPLEGGGGFSAEAVRRPSYTPEAVDEARRTLRSMLQAYDEAFGGQAEGVDPRYGFGLPIVSYRHETVRPRVLERAGRPAVFKAPPMGIATDHRGQRWLVVHRTTKSVQTLATAPNYRPDLDALAWIYSRPDAPVGGLIFDVVRRATRPAPSDFKLVKSGDRLSRQLPTGTDAEALRDAYAFHGLELDEWARSKIAELEQLPSSLVRRHWIPLAWSSDHDLELSRISDQIAEDETEIRYRANRWAAETEGIDELDEAERVAAFMAAHGGLWPRNPAACEVYGRACPVLDACRSTHPDAVRAMVRRPADEES